MGRGPPPHLAGAGTPRRAGRQGPAASHLRDLGARHPGRVVIALGTIGWLLGLVGAEGRPEAMAPASTPAPRPVERVTVPPEYAVLAERLADKWRANRDATEAAYNEAEAIADLHNFSLDLGALWPADPDIATVISEARTGFDEMAASIERLLALPRPPGMLDSATEGFVRGLLLDLPGATRQHDKLVAVRDDRLAEGRRLAATLRRTEAAKLMLPRLAARHARVARPWRSTWTRPGAPSARPTG